MNKPNYLSRHEIGEREIEQMQRWHDRLYKIVNGGGNKGKRFGASNIVHFEVELRRVNRWLRGVRR